MRACKHATKQSDRLADWLVDSHVHFSMGYDDGVHTKVVCRPA